MYIYIYIYIYIYTYILLAGPAPPSFWPESPVGINGSMLIDSDPETCIDFPPAELLTPAVVKVHTDKFMVKRFALIHENLRDTMDPCNGLPFLVMTQTGAENIADARCRPYCGRAVRCHLHNEGGQVRTLPGHNMTATVDVECHCQSVDGCNGIFLQISLTSLVNQQAPGTLCEIDLSPEYTVV